ncbi:hypothetical protein HY224_02445 [Candidatus Uhrbacteria bacterium]|nr:hypothetical protein [Candidatus Uhrbacteria bacterium]
MSKQMAIIMILIFFACSCFNGSGSGNDGSTASGERPVPRLRGVTVYPNLNAANCLELRSWGVNSVWMMPMIGDLLDLQTQKADPIKLKHLHDQLDLCRQHGLFCIIDLHELPGLVRWTAGAAKSSVFSSCLKPPSPFSPLF